MIVLAVLFGVVTAGLVAIGALALRARRAAGVLSRAVARASDEYRASSADLRERVGRGDAGP
ncbi:hypothetical protein KGD83_18295 [Nocardiopsis akebiae]|uniref:Secreted protein n=1 Tax=Nocardiopsis akebiae TaxID=2831968 RepID=A0ABX8BZY3_9ACTN|nr:MULTISPECIES: hypothetical protein [Nocardiopsis]MCK9868316.1 hypothetical protein [Nocardiopsis dassonvillei]QUX27265.1 hypothetical protein KGD83_18295 [Nocardiopsis akebiae]